MKFLPFILCLGASVAASAQIKNIKLAEISEGTIPARPTMAINHKDQKNLVASIGLNRLLYTTDGGKTWIENKPETPFACVDNVAVIADSKDNFELFHLANGKGNAGGSGSPDRIVCQTSIDKGEIWTTGVAIGNSPSKILANPRVAVHAEESDIYLTWTQLDQPSSGETACQSNLMFSQSGSHGKRWSDPVRINQTPADCSSAENNTSANVVVNPEGRMFVSWFNQGTIFLDRSYDRGSTWLSTDMVIASYKGGSLTKVPGMGTCTGLPSMVTDNSATFFRGSLYVVWADQSAGENDTDIWFARSTNRGDSWTKPGRVNKDGPGKHQFLPAVTVDQATGVVYVLYYDRRGYDDLQTDVYLAYSLDGTNHFNEMKISENSFLPSSEKSPGSTWIVAHKGVVVPVWTRVDNGQVSVWTAIINQEEIFKKADLPKLQTLKRVVRPRPADL